MNILSAAKWDGTADNIRFPKMGWNGKTGKESKEKGWDGMREEGDGKKCQERKERDLEGKDWEGMGRMRKNGKRRRGKGRYVGKGEEDLRATVGKGCEEMERKGIYERGVRKGILEKG
jgi:hypothetical protein